MKKLLYLLPIFLMSCVKFHGTDVSIWSGGMWIILVVIFGGSAFFFLKAFLQSRGGTLDYEKDEKGLPKLTFDGKKIPVVKTPYFIFAIALLGLGIGFIIVQVLEA